MKTQLPQNEDVGLLHWLKTGNRRWILVVIALVVLVTVIASTRFLAGEDDWMCKDGQWVRHGNPSAPMPTAPCR